MLLQESGKSVRGPITLGLTAPFDCKCCVSSFHIGRMRTVPSGEITGFLCGACVCLSSSSN